MKVLKKKKETKWTQVGNFQLGIEKNQNGVYLVCKAVSGIWSIRWRDDTLMFGIMFNLMQTEGSHEYLHTLITLQYTATTYPHDMVALIEKGDYPLMKGFAKLVKEQNEFEISVKGQPTEEEHEEALKNVREMTELAEEMSEMEE